MDWLEKRVPPLMVAGAFALLMALLAQPVPPIGVAQAWRLVMALVLLVVGLGICLAGVASFRLAQTTVNPLAPEQATALVQSGIYRYTRNPMYLGFALVLLAWAALLAAPLSLLGVAGFVLYLDRLQIAPEERALAELFGAEYAGYCKRVRRWL